MTSHLPGGQCQPREARGSATLGHSQITLISSLIHFSLQTLLPLNIRMPWIMVVFSLFMQVSVSGLYVVIHKGMFIAL